MNTNIRSTSKKVVSMFLVLAMIMTVLIQFPTKAYATSALELQMYNTNTSASTNTLNPNIMLRNTGTEAIDLSTVKIKYYYTKDSTDNNTTQSFTCDYCTTGTDNVTGTFHNMTTTTTTADTYVEIGFTSGTLATGNTVELQARIYNSQWSNYTQTNDYSFNATASSYTVSNNVPVYVGDTLAFGTEPISSGDNPNPPDPSKEKFLVIVASSLYSSITTRLNEYVSDVYDDGYNATVIKVSNNANDQSADYICTTAPELKNVIKSYYNNGYKGFVFIGSYPEIPVVRWVPYLKDNELSINNEELSISDYYYADVDLNNDKIAAASEDWPDTNNDGIFEASNVVNNLRTPLITQPDMFYGRIDAGGKSSTVAGQAQLINSYLQKVHNFRVNRDTISAQKKSALGFIDDDWQQYYETDPKLRTVFDNIKMVQDKYATNSITLNDELSNDYYFMDIISHGGPDLLQLANYSNGERLAYDYRRETIEGMKPLSPKAYYIHSFGCCTSRYVGDPVSKNVKNLNTIENIPNLGESYLFDNNKTVNVTGVCGSIWNNLSEKYFTDLCSMSIGEAYKEWLIEWFEKQPSYSGLSTPTWECVPNYVLLGDPTLKHPLQVKTDDNVCPDFNYPNTLNELHVNMGELFTKVVYPVDEDGDIDTVEMIEAPTGATFNADTNTITWTPTTVQQAMEKGQKFVLKITDTAENTYTEQFNVYVDEPNDFNLSFDLLNDSELPIGWNTISWRSLSTFSSDDVVKHSDGKSAKISANSNEHSRFTRLISVNRNTDYLVSGYIKTEDLVNNESQEHGANLRVNCNGSITYADNYLVGDNDWTYVVLLFNSGNNDTAKIECSLGADGDVCTGTAWFDDITLQEVE